MIRFQSVSTATLDDDLSAFLDGFSEIVAEVGSEVTEVIRPLVLDELRYTPPKRSYPDDYPIEWTSARQRRYVMMKLRKEKNIPYRRTGALARAWEVKGFTDGGTYMLVLSNSSPIAKFVVGSLAKDKVQAARFQQRFHAITGWPLASLTADFFAEAAEEEFVRRLDERLGDLVGVRSSRRAYTKGRRRQHAT